MRLFTPLWVVSCATVVVAPPPHGIIDSIMHRVSSSRYLMVYPPVASVVNDTHLLLHVTGIYYKLDSSDFPTDYSQPVRSQPGKSSVVDKFGQHAIEEGKNGVSADEMSYRMRLFMAEHVDEKVVTDFAVAVGQFNATEDRADFEFGDHFKVGDVVDSSRISQVSVKKLETDGDGYFEVDLNLRLAADAASLAPTGNDQLVLAPTAVTASGGLVREFRVRLSTKTGDIPVGTLVTAHVLDPVGVSVVSDIDDTIKVSHITASLQTIFETAMYSNYRPVPGMSEAYNSWAKQFNTTAAKMSFHYVSGSSWTMAPPYYNQFLTRSQFPSGTLTSKNNLVGLADAIKDPANKNYKVLAKIELPADTPIPPAAVKSGTFIYKSFVINKLISQAPPTRSFVLIGDSTEFDPEVYSNMVQTWGWSAGQTDQQAQSTTGRIQCVFLRAVQPIISDADEEHAEHAEDAVTASVSKTLSKVLGSNQDIASLKLMQNENDLCPDGTPLQSTGSCLQRATPEFLQEFTKRVDALFAKWPDMRASRVRIFHDGADLSAAALSSGQCS